MATIFSKIVAGEIPSYKVAENDCFYAFLDINPLVKGHTLVIPKHEVDYIFDLEDEELAAMHLFAKSVAKAIEKAVPCKRIGVAVMGLEVPHAHIHLIPINKESDMIISNPKQKLSDEEFSKISESIKSVWEAENRHI
ncbi:HIT family protein [uncultured Bacteroides sp.]|uniref:HIT family protein n=1 Tax=uncultured Bacteroides sp. TaxID=162156 RepID=UPI002AAB899C|nr:HIT family protein [uncultured Bacteroides sp.]